jgi:hypothetical protein
MSADRTTPPQRVPILTEVVLLPEGGVDIQIDPPPPATPVMPVVAAPLHVAPAANSPLAERPEDRAEAQRVEAQRAEDQRADEQQIEEQLVEDVWTDLQRQVDLMLEYRVRETLAPILTRATEAVIRESRQQLASTLRDMVARAVAQELARHRGR